MNHLATGIGGTKTGRNFKLKSDMRLHQRRDESGRYGYWFNPQTSVLYLFDNQKEDMWRLNKEDNSVLHHDILECSLTYELDDQIDWLLDECTPF